MIRLPYCHIIIECLHAIIVVYYDLSVFMWCTFVLLQVLVNSTARPVWLSRVVHVVSCQYSLFGTVDWCVAQ